jgi:hypothetical protein
VNSPANPLSLEKNACIFCLWLDLQFVHVENIGALHNHNRQRLHRFFPGICRPSGVLTRHWKKTEKALAALRITLQSIQSICLAYVFVKTDEGFTRHICIEKHVWSTFFRLYFALSGLTSTCLVRRRLPQLLRHP